MEKRFRQTAIWGEPWYRKLSPLHKCFWDFLCDSCDKAGVWVIDEDAVVFYLGEPVDLENFRAAVNIGKERVEFLAGGKLWLTGFVEFQYGKLSEKCVPHRRIIDLVKKHGLADRVPVGYPVEYPVGYEVPTGRGEERKGEERKGEEGSGEKQKSKTKKPNIPAEQEPDTREMKTEYKKFITDLKTEVATTTDKRKRLAAYITDNKPQFIEPYADMWNMTVQLYGLSQVQSISTSRESKFRTRIREESFDFIKILTEIRASDYLQGKKQDWKVDWDWIFENDTNYLKIIEGKYRNQQ